MEPRAEEIYVFIHAALRDAAYQLWLPSDRGRLHGVALDVLSEVAGGNDKWAYELAGHAHDAQQGRDLELEAEVIAHLLHRELELLWRALEAAQADFQHRRAVELYERILGSPALTVADAATAHGHLAHLLLSLGRQSEARAHFEQELALGRQLRSARHMATSLLGLGRLQGAQGRMAEAERLLSEAIEAARSGNEIGTLCTARNWMAGLYEDTGRAHLTEAHYRETMRIAKEGNVPVAYYAALGNLSNHLRHVGRLEESAAAMKEVLAGFAAAGSTAENPVAYNNMGRTLYMLGRLDEADAAFSKALEILKPQGQVSSLAFSLGNVALVWMQRGKIEQARDALIRAVQICDELALLMYGAAYKSYLAELELLLGRRERAQELIEDARSDFANSGSAQYIPDYCDIVRLRIAADAATENAAPVSRKTARLGARAPQASWLPVMRQILKGMKDSLAQHRVGDLELQRNIAKGEALLAEMEAAVREGRAARVFRGFLPSELSAELHAELRRKFSELSVLDALR